MKLYVDDLRACPGGWHLARTVTEAIRVLATQEVSAVSIDHDITHTAYSGVLATPYACTETFEPVARYLAAIGYDGPVNLHTANAVGANKMSEILKEAGITATITLANPPNDLE